MVQVFRRLQVYHSLCTKALGVCDSASKVDQNWFVKRIAKSSYLWHIISLRKAYFKLQ